MHFSARACSLKGFQVLALGFVLLAGCNNDLALSFKDGDGGVVLRTANELCDSLSSPPAGCGESLCALDSGCVMGMFCFDGTCAASCTATEGCASNERCTGRGRCEAVLPDGGLDLDACIPTDVTPARITPNVFFIVDESGSMQSPFGNTTRWRATHDAISAVVDDKASIVRFGMATYRSPGVCLDLTEINMLDYSITDVGVLTDYPESYPHPGGNAGTPTGAAIAEIVNRLEMNPPPEFDNPDVPQIFVLATDGEPNGCSGTYNGTDGSLLAVGEAHDEGFDTYILSVGMGTVSEAHLQDMANVGVGKDASLRGNTAADFWVAGGPTNLAAQFDQIVSENIPCDVTLNKQVADGADICNGVVTMDGAELDCGTDYRLKPNTNNVLELLGTACDTWKTTGRSLSARFDCGVIVE